MENSPYTNEHSFDSGEKDNDEKPERKKDKAAGGHERPAAISREGPRDDLTNVVNRYEGLWRRLTREAAGTAARKIPSERTEADKPPTATTPVSAEESRPTLESYPPLTTLGPDERELVIRRLVEASWTASAEDPDLTAEPEATAGVSRFHEAILFGNQSPQDAFEQTLVWLETGGKPALEPSSPAADTLSDEWLADTDIPVNAPVAGTEHQLAGAGTPPSAGPGRFAASPNWPDGSVPGRTEAVIDAAGLAESAPGYSKADVVGAALISGLVGYLIGRRRGRIKTEKRLIPIQKKLEKQVKELQQDITKQEFAIRAKAAEYARERQAGKPIRAERSMSAAKLKPEHKQLGKVLVAAEALPPAAIATRDRARTTAAGEDRSGKRAAKPAAEQAAFLPIHRHVETLSRRDLLELSSKIIIEGESLKQIYKSHRIGEKALRRIVSKHLRGGDVGKALNDELIQHEIDFERDPFLRDRPHASPRSSTKSKTAGLQLLMQRASDSIGGHDMNTPVSATGTEAETGHQSAHPTSQRQHRFLETVSLVVIVVLLSIAILLIITRS